MLSTSREINAAFAAFVRERPDALFVGTGPFLTNRRVQLALLAGRHGIPAIYGARQYTDAGGLMNYGPNIVDAYRRWAPMPVASSRARSLRTCQSYSRQRLSW